MDGEAQTSPTRPLGRGAAAALVALALLTFAALLALGVWQLQRLQWKLELIARTEQRLAAPPVAAPGPVEWTRIGREDAYRRVVLRGTFRHELETCTQAVTELGAGCWVLTPLQTRAGFWVLVNRGFVPPAQREPASRMAGQTAGEVSVEGLLRLTEPKGGFLRRNQPQAERWYSRDVAAIGAARGLPADAVAPYFVDASESAPGGPVGGLTVVRFKNHHLVYALTWFALAGMVVFGSLQVLRRERRLRAKGAAE